MKLLNFKHIHLIILCKEKKSASPESKKREKWLYKTWLLPQLFPVWCHVIEWPEHKTSFRMCLTVCLSVRLSVMSSHAWYTAICTDTSTTLRPPPKKIALWVWDSKTTVEPWWLITSVVQQWLLENTFTFQVVLRQRRKCKQRRCVVKAKTIQLQQH